MATTAWTAKMRKPQKFTTRYRNRCQICGRPRAGFAVTILSTSQGVVTDKQAQEKKVGGEVLCQVW